jgi:hypothetical protein
MSRSVLGLARGDRLRLIMFGACTAIGFFTIACITIACITIAENS